VTVGRAGALGTDLVGRTGDRMIREFLLLAMTPTMKCHARTQNLKVVDVPTVEELIQ
jgi:hypothetical protein